MQEPGLTEIIPLICTSATWGQYPVFSCPELPQGSPQGVAAGSGHHLMAARWQVFFSFLTSLRAHQLNIDWLWLQSLMTVTSFVWWCMCLMFPGGIYHVYHTWLVNLDSNPVSPYVRDHTDIHKKPMYNLHFAVCFIYVSCINVRIGP